MGHRTGTFRFAADLTGRISGASFHWRLPPDIVHAGELFSAFAKALWLPRDFQSGWDGLFACLCDFGWMTDRKIVLVHERLPKLSDAELKAYLATLRDAVRWWDDDDPHQLEVVFPESERERVNRLLGVTPRP